ncbi:hypothetical protein Tsubulata_032534 [Turnera subulata]|uniref:RING-type E3 ubiquitin transferase n=1 Tax=Turnera subulata TaxID=218843 RepID=A0A9Q0FKL3_9ROSI|nr:hypothetical protein Tsubulata_032534 [Turnera subulata]
MRTKTLLLVGLLTLLDFSIIIIFATPDEDVFHELSDPKVVFTYSRLSEVEKHCASFLSSASELKPDDDNTGYTLMSRLSFGNGEWHQDSGGMPLMPYDDTGIPSFVRTLPSPLKLASFSVKDISSVQHFPNAVSLGGTLLIGITRESSVANGYISAPNVVRPGTTALTFAFEGIYTETKENGGERCLCLLGNSTVPNGILLETDAHFRFGLMEIDDQILLTIRYPMTFNFTKRTIHGVMRSLDEHTNAKFFGTVHIFSQVSGQLTYEYSSKVQASATCDQDIYHDEISEDGFRTFSGSDFCNILYPLSMESLGVITNYKFGGKYVNGSKFGAVLFGKELQEAGLKYNDVKLVMQHVQCDPDTTNEVTGTAKVAMVFRAIPAEMDPFVARTMTGLSGLKLYAEGIWDPSSGQLCMVGYPEGIDPESNGYTSRISLFFPRALSIKQRSIIFGGISSLRMHKGSIFHLLFDLVLYPSFFKEGCNLYNACYLKYSYTKIEQASAFRKRTGNFQLLADSKLPFSSYPALKDAGEPFSQLDQLSKDLHVEGYAAPHQLSDGHGRLFIEMEVLSVGPLVGGFDKSSSRLTSETASISDRQLFNVSAHLIFKEGKEETREYTIASYKNISQLFLEGLYDSLAGEMYLIACRKLITSGSNTERGLDCLIEVNIQYPNENAQWMANPVTKISITSQRNEDDPLFFSSATFQTSLTHYHDQYATVAYRRTFEGVLKLLLLAAIIAISLSQIHYMKEQAHVVPCISLIMLALMLLDYSLPLICGTEILLKLKESDPGIDWSYVLPWYSLVAKVLDYAGRFLSLIVLLVTAKILLMVSQSRRKLLSSSNKKHLSVPSSISVPLITVTTYTIAFLIWQVIFKGPDMVLYPEDDRYGMRPVDEKQNWIHMLEDFARMVQDLFLLPQILSNLLGRMYAKSLRKTYYIGMTLVRVILHLYEYSRDPILEFKFQEHQFETPKVAATKLDNIVMVTAVITLAAIVHCQQKTQCKKMSLSPA